MLLPYPCPADPRVSTAVPWDSLSEPWIAPMASCPQDPEHHAEGDVWTHTKMVCEALVGLPGWQALAPADREVVFAAALLHDIAKPVCTRIEDGRIRQPGHSPRGALMVRAMLWKMGVAPAVRERIAALVRTHQIPFFLIDQDDARRRAAKISQTVRCDHLALLTRADALGRICRDVQKLLDNIDLFVDFCAEHECLDQAWTFPSAHTRFVYFRSEDRDPRFAVHDDTRCEVVLMSGLPGSGKDHWIAHNLDLPVVSLDALREELDLDHTGPQHAVIQAAREQAREHLRRGQSFVWNATNLSRDLRGRLIDLCADYGARVRIVFLDTPYRRVLRQNRERAAQVPLAAIERMLARWEPPDLTEAHQVEWIVQEE
ncbi:AAA family ATPase [Nannocystis sp. SCPEA4]|uniref:AAA family ATPase n=1 Tax=Nannocystis sp. SCPEA4 TaxID=2996787 RepID=UPI002270D65E|nr:AAA family ATPase [Nannocystis sp. SCPEA4]MCY1061202.1 AAA family ATPase [Nannocystis sp. SCPEA4]